VALVLVLGFVAGVYALIVWVPFAAVDLLGRNWLGLLGAGLGMVAVYMLAGFIVGGKK
jgi:hypothetical protein